MNENYKKSSPRCAEPTLFMVFEFIGGAVAAAFLAGIAAFVRNMFIR